MAKRDTSPSKNGPEHHGARAICERHSRKSENTQTGRSNPPRNFSIMPRSGKKEWSARRLDGKRLGGATPLSTSRTWGERLGSCQIKRRSIRNFRFRDLPICPPPGGLVITDKSQSYAYGRQWQPARNRHDDFHGKARND